MRGRIQRTDGPTGLLAAIADPRSLLAQDKAAWEVLLSCARRNGVLAYLASRAESAGVLPELPGFVRNGLGSARLSAARIGQLALWELDRVRRVLQPAGIPVMALKGVAYLLRCLPHATTRRMGDIDVMVPKARLAEAERILLEAGWVFANRDAYDQQYYRRWAHELPPLQFPGRMLAVDVHHTICPPLSRLRPDPEAFWADSEACDDSGVRVLSRVDSVLHAAVHLFFDSDFDGRFRDLADLHELLLAFGAEGAFWQALVERARTQALARPLYYALQSLDDVLHTPIPEQVRTEVAAFGPPAPVAAWMRRTMASVLAPIDPEPWPPLHRIPLWLLYVRSHWLRMPAHRLVPHLVRKALRRRYRAGSPG